MNETIDRRDFIRTFTLLAGTSMVASGMPWLKSLNAQSSGRVVRLGIIGFGSRARALYLWLKDIPDLDICCVCDDYEPHLKQAQDLLPKANTYADYRVMLEKEKLDAVVIATPLHEHARMTIDALNAGIHVFCEKNLARTIEDVNDMLKAHLAADKNLYVGHQRMFDMKFRQAYKMINDGKIGPVTRIRANWHRNNDWRRAVPSPDLERKINWRLYHEYSCGLMTELASHHIQVANEILGQHPEYAIGSGSLNYWKDGREVDDDINVVFKYPNDTHLLYDSLISNSHYGCEIQVLGSKGNMEIEAGKMWDQFPPPPPGILQLINHIEHQIFDVIPIAGASWVPETADNLNGKYIIDKVMEDDGTKMLMEAFVADVRAGRVNYEIAKQGFYCSVASLIGFEAIQNRTIVYWPQGLIM